MQVLVVRHAEAVDMRTAPSDDMRWLTNAGRMTAERVGKALGAIGLRYACIYTSPLVRAVQTAELLAASPPDFHGPVEVHPPLSTDYGSIDEALEPLSHGSEDDLIVLVSHMPKVRVLAGQLCGMATFPGFSAGAACLVQLANDGGALQWMMDPTTTELTRAPRA